MEDARIVALYFARDESAIGETKAKYGGVVTALGSRLLDDRLAISRFRKNRAEKRYAALEAQLDELAEMIPDRADVEREIEGRELGRAISRWLDTLAERDRTLFVRRYFYGESLKELARDTGERSNTLAQRLRRLRLGLRESLAKEEFTNEA